MVTDRARITGTINLSFDTAVIAVLHDLDLNLQGYKSKTLIFQKP